MILIGNGARHSIFGLILIFSTFSLAFGQDAAPTGSNPALAGYADYNEVTRRVQELEKSSWASARSLVQTAGGREVWLLTLGAPREGSVHPFADGPLTVSFKEPPAFLIVGNVHAPHVVGCEIALGIAEDLVAKATAGDEGVVNFLKRFTVYVIPSPTPDATEKNFTRRPWREQTGNLRPTDDDRDFEIGEDPPSELNGDDWITMMRVHDDLGTHRAHDQDPRLLVPVDPKKNERGAFRLFVEAVDSDKDGSFGEDASDGVDFNRNHTFNYKYFGKGSGPHQVSEPETRAVVDFAFDHPNIAVVLTMTPEDNLFKPWRANAQAEREAIKTTLLAADAPFTDFLAERFRNLHGGKDAPESPKGEGSFSEWAYFHYGRWSFASRGWWIPKTDPPKAEKLDDDAKTDESKDDSADGLPAIGPNAGALANQDPQPGARRGGAGGAGGGRRGGGPPGDASGAATSASDGAAGSAREGQGSQASQTAQELNALNWFAANQIEGFVDWTPIVHPDFPNQTVEVGGFKPFYRLNPPAETIPSLIGPHVAWLLEVGGHLPTIELRDAKVESLGANLFRVTCKVTNTSFLPTMPEMGRVSREWYPLQVMLEGDQGSKLEFIEGSQRNSISRLDGLGGNAEQSWIVRVSGEANLSGRLLVYGPTITPVETKVEFK